MSLPRLASRDLLLDIRLCVDLTSNLLGHAKHLSLCSLLAKQRSKPLLLPLRSLSTTLNGTPVSQNWYRSVQAYSRPTLAGYGSNLTVDGTVECDASVFDGNSGDFGAVGAVAGLKNPIGAAHAVLRSARKRDKLGRIPPLYARRPSF